MSKKPNVIFILTDDQGPWAAGCYGNAEIRTPNIDRLAETGIRFAEFFCATPVCSPSRATYLTGLIPSQHGVHDWISGTAVGPEAVNYLEGETAYTDVLAEHGWTCGISGKWHMGACELPEHGFKEWYVHQRGGGDYNAAPMIRNGELITEDGYITDLITDQAVEYLNGYAEKEDPFYLSVHYTAPHSPWTGHPQDIVDSYDDCAFESCPQEPIHPWARDLTHNCHGKREMLKGYFAAVTAMDLGVGKIIDRVEELGLRDDTLIIFCSDNGYSCGHHGFWGKGNGTNPRNMYENSIKVPYIMSHPGRLEEGKVEESMLSTYDFMPTLLDYLGLPIPTEQCNLPGRSFAPLLAGKPMEGRDEVVIFDEYGPVRMIRTQEWKYVYRHAHGPHELWDMVNDPDERNNLIDKPEHHDLLNELHARMEAWFAKYVRPDIDGLRTPPAARGQEKKVSDPAPWFRGAYHDQ